TRSWNGANHGDRSERRTASTSAQRAMQTSAVSQIRRLTQKPERTRGNASSMRPRLKNWTCTRGHCGAEVTHQMMRPKKMTMLEMEISAGTAAARHSLRRRGG